MNIVNNINNNYSRIRRFGIHRNTPRVKWKTNSKNIT